MYEIKKKKKGDLVDLLGLANVSCFLLDSKYHGYYIHGKTIHECADASLEEINHNLENERVRFVCVLKYMKPCCFFFAYIFLERIVSK